MYDLAEGMCFLFQDKTFNKAVRIFWGNRRQSFLGSYAHFLMGDFDKMTY